MTEEITITGTAAGVPFVAVPPTTAGRTYPTCREDGRRPSVALLSRRGRGLRG